MIELAELIRDLRFELATAMQQGANEELRFEVGPVELEVSVSVEKQTDSAGKVRFWVVELGADRKSSHADVQRVKLTLQPLVAGTGAKPWVSGDEAQRER